MSRITGSEARGMIEAYAAVYAPHELTEEQVQEDFENWVNSLVEEGHDLSEFTWEEMYEEYITEIGQPGGNIRGGNRPISNAPYQSRFARPMNAGTPQRTGRATAVSRPQIGGLGGLGAGYRGQELQAGSRAAASQVGTSRQGSSGTGAAPSAAPRQQPPTRDASADTPAPKPPVVNTPAAKLGAKVAPTRPAAPAKPTGSAMDQWASTPANKKLAAAAAEKARIRGTAQTDNPMIDKGMRSRMQVTPTVQSPAVAKLGAGNQSLTQNKFAGQSPTPPVKAATPSQAVAATTKPVAPEVKATNTIAAKPSSAMSQDAIRKQRLNMEMEYDAYDLVLEYLLSNGHVETVEEAHYVMLEMEAEVIQDIVEETRRTEYLQKKFNRENRRKSGSAHTAIPGKQNTGQALQRARESERHMSGDN